MSNNKAMLTAKCRSVQAIYEVFIKYLMKRPESSVVNRQGAVKAIPMALKKDGVNKVIIITDPGLVKCGVIDKITPYIEEAGIEYDVYGNCMPEPSIARINECLDFVKSHDAEAIIAVGGGSSMDTAKICMALHATDKDYPIESLVGNSKVTPKVKKSMLPLYAVPTTSGTGSEATTCAVASDPETHKKYTIQDAILLPKRVFIDVDLMMSLPASITAATGMDALTHAVESYLGVYYGSRETDLNGLKAVRLIMRSLKTACEDGTNVKARQDMATGSYLAGVAFTTAAVGYAHSFAHSAAMIHRLPHGVLTSIMLPELLEYYYEGAQPKLAMLARAAQCTSADRTEAEQARDFIEAVKKLRDDIHLQTKLPAMSDLEIEELCERSLAEANPVYPVPVLMDMDDARAFVKRVSEPVA